MAVDATLVSPLRRNGRAIPGAHDHDGVALRRIAAVKRRTYREFGTARRCRLVVFGIKVGGRWSDEARDFVLQLAKAKARATPAILRQSATLAWVNRWSGILAVAAQRAFAASLLELPLDNLVCLDGDTPLLGDLLEDARVADPPEFSRLPPPPREEDPH